MREKCEATCYQEAMCEKNVWIRRQTSLELLRQRGGTLGGRNIEKPRKKPQQVPMKSLTTAHYEKNRRTKTRLLRGKKQSINSGGGRKGKAAKRR